MKWGWGVHGPAGLERVPVSIVGVKGQRTAAQHPHVAKNLVELK